MYRRDTVSTLLTIDYSDNLGASGIQADIKTASAFGVAASSVITALTSRVEERVKHHFFINPEQVADQIDASFDTFSPDAIKVGFLPNEKVIRLVADRLSHYNARNVVLDPLLKFPPIHSIDPRNNDLKLLEALQKHIFPLATLVTPDFEEALALAGMDKLDSAKDFGKTLYEKAGAKAILLKGGDSKSDYCTDILFTDDDTRMYRQSRIPSLNTIGSGSVLSSAIACCLAKGFVLPKAVRMAKDFVSFSIQKGLDMELSCGNGPLYIFNK